MREARPPMANDDGFFQDPIVRRITKIALAIFIGWLAWWLLLRGDGGPPDESQKSKLNSGNRFPPQPAKKAS